MALPVKKVSEPTYTVTYTVASSAMEPTLHCAQPSQGCEASVADGAVTRIPPGTLKRGDVVVFKTPGTQPVCDTARAGVLLIKRLIGLPGEVVKEDSHGSIWIGDADGHPFFKLSEPYIQPARRVGDTAHFNKRWDVPEGEYLLVGDNRDESCDSRDFGSVPAADIIGKVIEVARP